MDYWLDPLNAPAQPQLEMRANIVLRLIEHFGSIAGELTNDEDSAGRKNIRLQTPEELVERCVQITDIYIQKMEDKGWIKPALTIEERRALEEERYNRPRGKTQPPTSTSNA